MLVASFVGTNREFRKWLNVRTRNVVSLAEYREKRKTAQGERRERSCLNQA